MLLLNNESHIHISVSVPGIALSEALGDII